MLTRGKRRLKAAMPRQYPDHRVHVARRLRRVYDELARRCDLTDGVARRLAVMTAQAALAFEDLGVEEMALGPRRIKAEEKAAALARLRRRRAKTVGQYLAGLRTLEHLTAGSRRDDSLPDPVELLHAVRGGRE